MIHDLKGKKLLILGASPSEVVLVKRAQELGIYTIVTDYRTDRNLCKAKDVADEAWDISWSDLDALEKACKEHGVDGVTGGWSEILVENVVLLCERLGLPCYCTAEQLDITRNKRKFKNECVFNGVPVVNEYKTPAEVEKFPVIIKPVDRAGSIGISVANNREELEQAYNYAMELSICKDVIIEDFISDAIKFDTYYYVMDGEVILVSSDDVINSEKNGFEKIVQSGWVLPSRHHAAYIEKVDASIRKMIAHMGIQYGTLFFSGFANRDDEFVMFEVGFRLDGGYLQDYYVKKGFANCMDIYIHHALLGNTKGLERGTDLHPELKCANVNLYATHGTISEISGFDRVAQMPNCAFALIKSRIGQSCEDDKAILSKIGMYYFCSESADDLAADVEKAYTYISVLDENGNDMIYDRFDPKYVRDNWK